MLCVPALNAWDLHAYSVNESTLPPHNSLVLQGSFLNGNDVNISTLGDGNRTDTQRHNRERIGTQNRYAFTLRLTFIYNDDPDIMLVYTCCRTDTQRHNRGRIGIQNSHAMTL